jgi:hypothetical protein
MAPPQTDTTHLSPERRSPRSKQKVSYQSVNETSSESEEIIVSHVTLDDVEELSGSESELEVNHGAVFKAKPMLPPSTASEETLEDLLKQMNGPYLELNPEYQRKVVWNKARMEGLIESLMENYYVPPIIFNQERVAGLNGQVHYKRICVDGKQRLSSIKAFMEGDIGCSDGNNTKWYYCTGLDKSGKVITKSRRKILPENIKNEFKRKTIMCYEFLDLSRSQEEELFGRVQLGMQLSLAERLRATTGSWQLLAKDFEKEFGDVLSRQSSQHLLRYV